MEACSFEGFWWRQERSDDKVAGILHWKPDGDGLSLALVGVFSDVVGPGEYSVEPDKDYPVLFGLSNETPHEITLLGCRQSGTQRSLPGYLSESYRADIAVLGAHVKAEGEPLFTEVRAELGHLPDWSNFTGFSDEISPGLQFTYEVPQPIACTLPDGTIISLNSSASSARRAEERLITEHVTLGRQYVRPVPMPTLLEGMGLLQDLLTFATNHRNSLSRIQVVSPHANNDNRPLDLLLWTYQEIEPSGAPRESLHDFHMLFTLEESPGGFDQLMARWHAAYENVGTALHLLFSISYAPFMYVGTRFLHLAQSAEIYHRLRFGGHQLPKLEHRRRVRAVTSSAPEDLRPWLKKALGFSNELSLADRLRGLLSYAGPALEQMIEKPDLFVAVVRDTRNFLTHSGEKRKALEKPEDQYRLGEGVAWLLRACLMQELGFSKDDVGRLFARNNSFNFASRHVPAAAGGRGS